MTDPTIREQGYRYFLQEAPELLQALEEDLLSLREDCSINKVHNLMRTTHTIKGAAASVGLETIKTVAHYLEDIFKALCQPDISIDPEVEALLFEGYECLRLPLTAELRGGQVDEAGVKSRTAAVFAQLQDKLGDCFSQEAHLPSSVELGFDVTQSIFEVGVTQRLDELAAVIETDQSTAIATILRTQAEILLGLAESLILPGFGAIAQTAIAALAAHPEQAKTIAQISLADFREGQTAVLNGDRIEGGKPSLALQELAGKTSLEGREVEKIDSRADEEQSQGEEEQQVTSPSSQDLVTQVEIEPVTDAAESSFDLGESQNETDSLLEVIWGGIGELDEDIEVADESAFFSLDGELDEDIEIADDSVFVSLESELDEDTEVTDDSASIILDRQEGRQRDGEKTKRSPQPPTTPSLTELPSTVRVKVQHLEHLNYSIGELLTNHNRQLLQNEQLQGAVKTLLARVQQHRQLLDQLRDWSDRLFIVERCNGEMERRGDGEMGRRRDGEMGRWGYREMGKQGNNSQFPIPNSQFPNNQQQITNNKQQNLFDSLELDEYSEAQLLIQSVLEDAVQLAEANDAIELFARQSHQTLETQRRLLTSTRDVVMEARMVPLGEIFAPLPRILQQLEAVHHKPVHVEIRGTEVMADKVVAQKLYDPLLHLVRNAFDHGIESPAIRQEQGKPEKGQITICAYYRGRYLVIEVRDDGQGLDFEKIRQRAVERQLISPQQARVLNEAQLKELLFEPGFSTTSGVNDLSGRGIGLDVVRAHLQSLQGSVEVNSELHQGTSFILQIPQNLTISKLLLCQAGNRTYALLAEAIEQIIIPRPEQLRCWEDGKVLRWGKGDSEQLIPIYRLEKILDYSLPVSEPLDSQDKYTLASQQQVMPLMLIRCQNELLGLEVDQMFGDQELVIRPLGAIMVAPSYIYGSSILADGQLTLVIDGAALMDCIFKRQTSRNGLSWESTLERNQPSLAAAKSITQTNYVGQIMPSSDLQEDVVNLTPRNLEASQHQLTSQTHAALPGAPVSNFQAKPSKMVLLVDDSITLRQTLALTLEKANYQVVQAKDGYEALETLQHQTDIELVICDIEMPRMNGFEFLKYRQQDPALADIPVVILTSRSGEKHRLIATELGATTYLTKPYLEHELLTKVRGLFGQKLLNSVQSRRK